jgi:hypothetical protein
MLISDPPLPYAEIIAGLPMPAGSISPQRARCPDRLRRSPFPAALNDRDVPDNAEPDDTGRELRA